MQLLAKELRIHYWGCFAHLLNLIIRHAFNSCFGNNKNEKDESEFYYDSEEEEDDVAEQSDLSFEKENPFLNDSISNSLKKLFQSIRKIIGLFNSSILLSNELAESQGKCPLVLIQDVVKRWNSAFLMLERFVKIFKHVKTVLNKTTSDKYESHRTIINHMNNSVITRLEAVIEVLRPFYKVTLIMSSQSYATISIVLPACYYLKKKLEKTQPINSDLHNFQALVLESFNLYMRKYKIFENEFLCCASFLNTEYRDLNNCNMVEKALTTDRAIKFIKDFFKDNQLIEATDDSVNLNVDLNESFDSFSGKIDEESSQGNRGIASD